MKYIWETHSVRNSLHEGQLFFKMSYCSINFVGLNLKQTSMDTLLVALSILFKPNDKRFSRSVG